MNINTLIEKITPLYNSYKSGKAELVGSEALLIMWEIGDELKNYIDKNEVAPHSLYREIYGKGEGQTNIMQRSYITREFLGRCFRIRNMFSEKKEIQRDLPKLQNFTAFRESMPFFDNPKYKLQGKDKENLLTLLNSSQKPASLLRQIRVLQKQKIGIQNPRTQKLGDLDEHKETFIKFYNHAYKLVKEKDYTAILKLNIDSEYIKLLARNLGAISQDGLKSFELPTVQLPELWDEFDKTIRFFLNQETPKNIRRFRRLIPTERIVRLGDLLFALSSEENLKNYRI